MRDNRRRNRGWFLWTPPALLVVTASVFAQGSFGAAQDKALACRAAEADCYRKLAEVVYGIKITSDTFVRDLAVEEDTIRAELDALIRGIELGNRRWYEDGVCEVDAEVAVSKVVTALKKIHKTHYHGNRISASDYERITETFKTEVIRVTGSGVPRMDLPPDLPEGVESSLSPLPAGVASLRPPYPDLWRQAGPRARLTAESAARMDAMRKLIERIEGVRIKADTLVRDFVTESDNVEAFAQGLVIGAREVHTYLHEDELICEVTMEVPVEKVVTRITEFHGKHYRGNKVTTQDIKNIKKSVVRDVIRATGLGVPSPKYVLEAVKSGIDTPPWLAMTVTAVGHSEDAELDTAQGKLRAMNRAEAEALRELEDKVMSLRIEGAFTIGDYITTEPDVGPLVRAAISRAVVDPPSFSGGVAQVRASLPAALAWDIVRQHRVIMDRRARTQGTP